MLSVVGRVMETCFIDPRAVKSRLIIYRRTEESGLAVLEVFDRMYPRYGGVIGFHLCSDTLQQPCLDVVKDGIMLDNSEILGFGLELLVWVDSWSEHLRRTLGTHLVHLCGHLTRSCDTSVEFRLGRCAEIDIPLSLPSMKLKTDCSPKIHRKYQLILDIQRGSMSLVATPA